MLNNIILDYRTTRALQICMVFVTTLAIQRWLQFAHSAWIGFSVMMIYAGFDSGTSLHRTMHRFWGAMLGLFLSYILWFIIRLHEELILFIVPMVVFMAFFLLGQLYVSPTIFTVTLTALGTDYYTVDHYHVKDFFFDYARSTVIALGICVVFEYFIFRKNNLTHKFYFDLQQTLVRQLERLFIVVSTQPIRRSQYLKLSIQLNANIIALQSFLITVKHDYHFQKNNFNELEHFNKRVEDTYQNIRQMFINNSEQVFDLALQTRKHLDQLFILSQESKSGESI